MWRDDDDGREWWVPEGTHLITDPPYVMTAVEYVEEVNDWSSLVEVCEADPYPETQVED